MKKIKEVICLLRNVEDEARKDLLCRVALNELKGIEKNLEVLEIIKQHKLLNYVVKNQKCAEMYHLSEKELTTIKEWLKNDR